MDAVSLGPIFEWLFNQVPAVVVSLAWVYHANRQTHFARRDVKRWEDRHEKLNVQYYREMQRVAMLYDAVEDQTETFKDLQQVIYNVLRRGREL